MAKRENGSGTILRRRRASGVIYEAFSPASYHMEEGQMVCTRVLLGRFKRKADAQQAIQEYIQHPTQKYAYSLDQIYKEWSAFAFKDLSPQTKANYTSCWDKITQCPVVSIHTPPLKEITTGQIRQLLDYYMSEHTLRDPKTGEEKELKPLSRSYLTKIKSLLTQLYSYAMENNIVDRNYASLVKLPRAAERSQKRGFTDLEFQTLEKNWASVSGGDAVYALCYLGFRVSEFCQLTHFSYDPKAKTLTGGLKTDAGRDRIVPVHPKIQAIIESWYQRGCDTLYADPAGKPYDKDKFNRRVWRPALDALGLPNNLTPHSARHTCATMLSKAGARPEDIQKILGHEDYAMTANVYINQDINALTEAIQKMA